MKHSNKRAKMVLYRSTDYQTGLSDQEKKFSIDFQDSGHLGFPIRMILATFDLRRLDTSNEVSSRFPFWFRRKKVLNRFSTERQSSTSDQNEVSYFFIYKSSQYFLSSVETMGLSVQEFKIDFQDTNSGAHLVFPIGTIFAICDLHVNLMLSTSFESVGLSVQEKKRKTD